MNQVSYLQLTFQLLLIFVGTGFSSIWDDPDLIAKDTARVNVEVNPEANAKPDLSPPDSQITAPEVQQPAPSAVVMPKATRDSISALMDARSQRVYEDAMQAIAPDTLIPSISRDSASNQNDLDTLKKIEIPAANSDSEMLQIDLKNQENKDSLATQMKTQDSIPLTKKSLSKKELLGPVKVSKVNAIDQMKGEYRSPKKALFLSLAIPGAGQFYVGGDKWNHIRGGIYLLTEVILGGAWYYNSVIVYERQVADYKNYANKNYSPGQYERRIHDYQNDLDDPGDFQIFKDRYAGDRDEYCEAIYGRAEFGGCNQIGSDLNHTNEMGMSAPFPLKDISGELYNSESFYRIIAGNNYVLGWNGLTDQVEATSIPLEANDPYVVLGQSETQKKYRTLRADANNTADLQVWFLGGLILNHLVSAVDAGLSAHYQNQNLYEEKITWYKKPRFNSYVSYRSGWQSTVNAYWSF
jgi:hypothetical protein